MSKQVQSFVKKNSIVQSSCGVVADTTEIMRVVIKDEIKVRDHKFIQMWCSGKMCKWNVVLVICL